MNKSKRLVFFGTEDFSLPSLQALVDGGFNVVAVVTKPDSARGRSKKLVEPAVKTYAKHIGLTVFQPGRLADIQDQLVELKPDAGVLVSYGKLLPQRTLDVFEPIGIVNVHPSLLPKYRGPAPVEAAILNGDQQTGITIMKLTLGMDEGPIFAQTTVPLTGQETRPVLTKQLSQMGAKVLVDTLPGILENKVEAIEQKNSDATYTTLLRKEHGLLDPVTDNANALERKVRAYLDYPKTRLKIKNTDVIVTSAKVVESSDSAPLVVDCVDNTYLAIDSLIAPSGKTMSGEAYLRGLRN